MLCSYHPKLKQEQPAKEHRSRAIPLVVQQAKDLVFSLHWLRLQLWHGFHPWSGNIHMLRAWARKNQTAHTQGNS